VHILAALNLYFLPMNCSHAGIFVCNFMKRDCVPVPCLKVRPIWFHFYDNMQCKMDDGRYAFSM